MNRAWKWFIYALLFILFYTDRQQSNVIKELSERVEVLEQEFSGQCLEDYDVGTYNQVD